MDTVEIRVGEHPGPVFEIPIVREMPAVWVDSKPGAARERYRAAIVFPMCDHKHRSLDQATRCAFESVGRFAKHLKDREGAHDDS